MIIALYIIFSLVGMGALLVRRREMVTQLAERDATISRLTADNEALQRTVDWFWAVHTPRPVPDMGALAPPSLAPSSQNGEVAK